jgi:hypothetical protein
MISKDAMIRSAWHDSQIVEARKKVLDAMNYNLGHGYRLQHPGFRGLPDNSLGSKNRPFFAAKDEADVPLEAKIQSRGGGNAGALWNPAGRKYAQQILARRAVDSDALEEGMEAPQVVSPAESASPSAEKKLELNLMIRQLAITVTQGSFTELTFSLVKQTILLLFAIMPFMDGDELVTVYTKFDKIEEIARAALVEDVNDRSTSQNAFLSNLADTLEGITKLLSEYMARTEAKDLGFNQRIRQIGQPGTTRSLDDKRKILSELIKKYISDKDIVKSYKKVKPDISEQADHSMNFLQLDGGEDAYNAMMNLLEYLADPEKYEDEINDEVDVINTALELDIDVTDDDGNLLAPLQIKRLITNAIKASSNYRVIWKNNVIEIR